MATQDDIDITDPIFFANGDPHRLLARWRREDPVHWTRGRLKTGFWSITRYADARQVFLNDNRIFSVQLFGAALPNNPDLDDPETSVFIRLLRSGAQLSIMDGEPHTLFRRVFADRFSASSIAAIEALVRRCAEDALNRVLPRGECDFTVDIAGRLPLAVISEMMDIPREDWDDLNHWNNMMAAPEDPEFSVGDVLATSSEGTSRIMEYCTRLAHQRRTGSAGDLMSMLARAEIDGRLLNDDQLGFNGLMFFAAGHETTRAALSAGLLELIRDPAQMRKLHAARHDPSALRIAAEECIRWASPLTHVLRTATEDTEIGGQAIREGDWVVPWFISANRDEDAFVAADCFDVERQPNPHLGFAVGKHFCLGAHLARLELRIMLEYLLDLMPEAELTGPAELSASLQFWGIKHMPIKFPPRADVGDRRPTALDELP
jgi:cholest-4-en-3-one 26-monooxygenase